MNTEKRKPAKPKILIVDDSEMNRSILADILEEEYDVVEACDGVEAVNYMRSNIVDLSLVLLDLVMPRMDGFKVLEMMNNFKWIQDFPVIMISAENSTSYMVKAYELGATDYIQRPFDANVVRRRVINTIMLYAKQKKLVNLVEEQIYEKEKEQSLMINILSHIVEFRNGESGLHVLHIHTITELVLQELMKRTNKYPLTPQDITLIATASALHDIGKIAIDDKILNKPGRFTPEEFEIMKKHSEYGANMLKEMNMFQNEPLVRVAAEICRWHHERYDGRGYPDGLKGDDIPISAQVVALADVYDALTSERVYKPPIEHEKAVEMILNGECGKFNPILLEVLKNIAGKLRQALRTGGSAKHDIGTMTKEAIEHKELTVSKRTLDLLEHEREKYRFIAQMSNEILFELYATDPITVNFLDESSAERLGVDVNIPNPLEDKRMIASFGKENMLTYYRLAKASTHENPMVTFECDIKLSGVLRHCRIVSMSQYNYNDETEEYVYEGTFGKIEDISEERAKIEQLEWAATHDALTGLLNRAQVQLLTNHSFTTYPNKNYALAVIDIDDFKVVNDTYGHQFGDKVLKAATAHIRRALPSGGLAARVGGDEFLVVWEDKGKAEAEAQALFDSVKKISKLAKTLVSIGVARSKEVSRDYQELFKCADIALYVGKNNGKGRVVFYNNDMRDFELPKSAV